VRQRRGDDARTRVEGKGGSGGGREKASTHHTLRGGRKRVGERERGGDGAGVRGHCHSKKECLVGKWSKNKSRARGQSAREELRDGQEVTEKKAHEGGSAGRLGATLLGLKNREEKKGGMGVEKTMNLLDMKSESSRNGLRSQRAVVKPLAARMTPSRNSLIDLKS